MTEAPPRCLNGLRSFDLLLCDLKVPDATGWDLMEMLQREQAVRAIAFSSFDESSHAIGNYLHVSTRSMVVNCDPEPLRRNPSKAMLLDR